MNNPRHKTIPNLVPTFDPDPAAASEAAAADKAGPGDDIPVDEAAGDAAEYGRDGD